MLQNLSFSGQTAFITGASRGIGLATAETLAHCGARVILAARSLDDISAAAEKITNSGGTAHAVQCDVSDYASIETAINFCLKESGQLDILVNNAGVIEPLAPLVESDPALWAQAVDINYKGVYYAMRLALPHMLKRKSGIVVNISSGAANSALVGWSHYCSSKAGAKKITETAHQELAQHNIRVVGLSPGTVATDMMAKIRASKINAVSNLDWSSHIPPQWVGEAVAFLCGPGGAEFAGTDFSLKTPEGRAKLGLPLESPPLENAPD